MRQLLGAAARQLLRALGVTMTQSGSPLPRSPALLVANHISWLDIIAMLALGRVRLVAKSDVARWPLIGRLARLGGAIFIDRERPRTLGATVAEVRAALADGDIVVVFAEGTTSCGSHPIPYRPAVFQAAIDAAASVAPIHLRYRDHLGIASTAPAFIGDESLVTSLRRVLAMRGVHLDVHAGNCLHPEAGATRGDLARLAGLT